MRKESESNSALKVIWSNDLEKLAQRLIQFLFLHADRSPFAPRRVIVPDLMLKDFLLAYFLKSSALEVVTGIQIVTLRSLEQEVAQERVPSFLALSLAIEEMLEEGEGGDLIQGYYKDAGAESRKKRIALLSDALAHRFRCHSSYGILELEESWQQKIWEALFGEGAHWTYPIAALEGWNLSEDCNARIISKGGNRGLFHKESSGQIALFGFSYLSCAHLQCFASADATLFLQSPCLLFWEDFISSKERFFLRRSFEKKRIRKELIAQWENYASQGHPLLSNWGKMNREMLKNLDHFSLVEEEEYEEEDSISLLGQLKRSLLTLEEGTEYQKDSSIQVHSASSKLREVEILLDLLQTWMQEQTEQTPFALSDILILCPDIVSYAPYIEMVFGQTPFDFVILGLELVTLSVAVQGLLQLIALPQEDYSLPAVFALFENRTFCEKKGFSLEELGRIRSWCECAEIHGGLDQGGNSWRAGIERLLGGYAVEPTEECVLEHWPVDAIAHTDLDVFNHFLSVFYEICEDLKQIQAKHSVSTWLFLVLDWAHTYFAFDKEQEPFFQELNALAFSTRHLTSIDWDFERIRRVFFHLASTKKGKKSKGHALEKMVFSPLETGKVFPCRIIACLGLQEGAFPRLEEKNIVSVNAKTGYVPTRLDEDRALFLQLILNAKEGLILSYERIDPKDRQSQSPSLLIEELLHYTKGAIQVYHHPAFPLDLTYFSQDAPIRKWSQVEYLAAQAYYGDKKERKAFFGNPRFDPIAYEPVVDLKDLKRCARHPIAFYFQEALQMYLSQEAESEEKEFIFSRLERSRLRVGALKHSNQNVVHKLEAQGRLPKGIFQRIAIDAVAEDLHCISSSLKTFQITPEQIYSVHYRSHTTHQAENGDVTASLTLTCQGQQVQIVGVLPHLSSCGFLFHGERDLEHVLQILPLYLVYCCTTTCPQQLLCTKDGTIWKFPLEDPHALLASYLDYFFLAKRAPSPLMPLWAKAAFSMSQEEFSQRIRATMESHHSYYSEDPYLTYLQRRGALEECIAMLPHWHPVILPLERVVHATV